MSKPAIGTNGPAPDRPVNLPPPPPPKGGSGSLGDSPIYTASVQVMRSHDYCRFEINLASGQPLDAAGVDAMRKEAARLADKAVEQYKTAKEHNARRERDPDYHGKKEADRISAIPETDRTPDDQARLKAWCDSEFHRSRTYDYEDDWQDYDGEE